MTVLTVGHSTRPIAEFLELLCAHGVQLLADIRTVPRSRRNPQFNSDALPAALAPVEIEYLHLPGLGGLRQPRTDSPNAGWKNDSFRGYADHMQTPEFADSLCQLMQVAAGQRVAIMCAESLPWRCHRSLVADALAARGVEVEHIMTATKRQPHKVTPFARTEGERVTYPGLFTSN
ncbi:MAG TPA: DUF488 domain-containing protein [Bryobacteraceae bacterium]|nr:DUF488 domain-containing protein [Bryobacteraceae bacterium]